MCELTEISISMVSKLSMTTLSLSLFSTRHRGDHMRAGRDLDQYGFEAQYDDCYGLLPVGDWLGSLLTVWLWSFSLTIIKASLSFLIKLEPSEHSICPIEPPSASISIY